MSDRYTTITREVPVDRPRNTVFASTGAPSGELNSQHRVSLHPAGFRVRERGATDATVVHAYRCPVHGAFEVAVSRSEVPDAIACPWGLRGADPLAPLPQGNEMRATHRQCGQASPWAGSSCGIGHAAGEVTC